MVTQSTPDGSLLESGTVQRPLAVTMATLPDVDVAPKVFEVDDLAVYYGPFRAVREVTLDVRRHEITAFIGPSGCGKTTVLRCLNRMNDLIPGARVEGSVRYRGQDLYASTVSPSEVRRHIGMRDVGWARQRHPRNARQPSGRRESNPRSQLGKLMFCR